MSIQNAENGQKTESAARKLLLKIFRKKLVNHFF